MKLLVIFTGGTIGSSVKDGYISVDEGSISRIISEVSGCADDGNEEVDVRVVNPYTILSENLNGKHIAALVKCINENITGADGIVICHGTDTLQYTAAALGLAFREPPVPIVLVSSNYVLDDPRANGIENLKNAIDFISGRAGAAGLMNRMSRRGVWVSYKNEGEDALLYEPFELLPHQAYDDRLRVMNNSDTPYNELNEACLKLEENSGIMWIKAYPGISYPGYIGDGKNKPECILLDSYHSGTVNTADAGLYRLTRWAAENSIPVYLIGLEPGVSYETTKAYRTMGIKILPKMSPVTAYMWLWLSKTAGVNLCQIN